MNSNLHDSRGVSRQLRASPEPQVLAFCLHLVVVFLVFSIWVVNSSPSHVLLYGGLICLPAYLVMAWLESRRAPLRLSPLSFYLAWSSIGLGASALYMSKLIAHDRAVSFSVTVVGPQDLATGYLIYLFGSMILHLGMSLRSPRPAQAILAALRSRAPYVSVIFFLGLLRLAFPAPFAPLGTIGNCLNYGAIAGLSVFALHPYFRKKVGPVMFWGALSVGTLILLLIELRSGSKAYIMYAFIPVVWFFLVDRSLRKFLPFLAGGLAIFYLTIVAPVVMASRIVSHQTSENKMQLILNTFSAQFGRGDEKPTPAINTQKDNFLFRMFDPTPVGFFVHQVKEGGLLEGKSMANAFYAFIPRILWPEKPTVTRGAWFDYYVGQARSPQEAKTSLGMTAIGELYWNFGLPGVLLGMFAIGLMEGQLWRLAGSDPRSSALCMLLYVTQTFEMPNMPDAVTVVSALVATWLIFRTLLLLAEGPHRRQQHSVRRFYACNPAR